MSASSSMVGMSTNHSTQSMSMQSDPNSIEAFKHNIQDILKDILHLQNVARNTLLGIQNAYHPGNSPTQTEANIVALKQELEIIADKSVNIGVGALPILHIPSVPTNPNSGHDNLVPSEAQMIADATRSIKILFERIKRVQESAGTVANLLQVPTITNAT
ncbi:hypothetical protein J3R30DRAFT_2860527 [Lentinula aciculospora]|uniref:Mediator of RNA polymerase II transcription subunit 11 n=1 Tax=Lentinula aciculospora TaxID=153920 RepID=A0A9W9DP08_9AGAR|nr:hypothetical protein J3R30DRAFT_2860527 [Lentinula aciculospora]